MNSGPIYFISNANHLPLYPDAYPIAMPRQGLIGNIIMGIGNMFNQGNTENINNDNSQTPNQGISGITPEDVQAIWISGFPMRSVFPRYIYA